MPIRRTQSSPNNMRPRFGHAIRMLRSCRAQLYLTRPQIQMTFQAGMLLSTNRASNVLSPILHAAIIHDTA